MAQSFLSARLAQTLVAVPFLVLGGWCLLLPDMVVSLSFRPEVVTDSRALTITMGCFGAQAVLGGLFALCSRFTARTFAVYAVALLPFFGFNYYFTIVDPVFTNLMLLDFGANLAMLLFCWVGWRAARAEEQRNAPVGGT